MKWIVGDNAIFLMLVLPIGYMDTNCLNKTFIFQIDFYTTVVIEGLVIYNWVFIHGQLENNTYFESTTTVGCRSFYVSYAMFQDDFKFYMNQVR